MEREGSLIIARGCEEMRDIQNCYLPNKLVDDLKCHSKLEKLRVVLLEEDDNSRILLEVAENCPNLTQFQFIGNFSNTGLLKLIENCSHIQQLEFRNGAKVVSNVEESTLILLARKMVNLVEINLEVCFYAVTDTVILELMTNCKLLISLSVKWSLITDIGIQYVAKYGRHLEVLNVSECKGFFELSFLALLETCVKLKTVRTINTNITSASAIYVTQNTKLLTFNEQEYLPTTFTRDLYIDSVAVNTHGLLAFNILCLTSIAIHCPLLTELTIHKQPTLTDDCLSVVFTHCPSLQVVDLFDSCDLLTHKTITSLTEKCPCIHTLHCNDLNGLTDAILLQLIQNKPNFKSLKFERVNTHITDVFINQLPLHCPNLVYFAITCNTVITTAAIVNLITSCSKLRTLNLFACDLMNTDILTTVIDYGYKLRELYLEQCDVIKGGDVAAFLFTYHNLKKLTFGDGFTYDL
jgi:hypothetical protein